MQTWLTVFFLIIHSQNAVSKNLCEPKDQIKKIAAECISNILENQKPDCLKLSANEIAEIKKTNPESVLQTKMSALSPQETFVRLIFSENLASNCPNEKIAEGIAMTLKARSENSKKNIIFEKQQFRSSTGDCDVAKRSEFLCPDLSDPKQKQAWEQALAAYKKVFLGSEKTPQVTHYFFLKHFDNSKDSCAKWKGIRPSWSKPEKALADFSDQKQCAEFYNLNK